MGRRRKTRKKILLRPPKKLPKIFTCPHCGATLVNVKIDKKAGKVVVTCGGCGLTAELNYVEGLLPVDYFNKFTDMYYQGLIQPKERVITISELAAESQEEEVEAEEVEGEGGAVEGTGEVAGEGEEEREA